MKLSKSFSLAEFLENKHHITVTADEKQITNLKILCECVLEPIVEKFKIKPKITSGLRDVYLNDIFYGKSESPYLRGLACDIKLENNEKLPEIFLFILQELEFDKVIFYNRTIKSNRTIHVSYRPKGLNRNKACISEEKGNVKKMSTWLKECLI